MKIISVVNHKGGVGKSTISLNLALCFGFNLNVGLVDADAQGSITNLADMINVSIKVEPPSILNNIASNKYDLMVVDTPPYHTPQLKEIIRLSDFVLVPIKPGYFDVLAVKPTIRLIKEVQSTNAGLKGAIVLNMVKHRTSINKEIKDILAEYELPTLNTILSERISYTRSPLSEEGVFGLDDEKAKTEMTSLVDEILTQMGL